MEANTNLPGIGDRLANRYRIMFGRGAGPSGAVFKALDLENDLSVALKVLNPGLFEGPFAAMNIARLSRACEVEDPNVVKVYDFIASEGRHFVTSLLVEGLSLRAVLDLHDEGGEHFPVPKLKGFGERMLNGVRAFHRKGIVHGNIKPENFFVLPDRLALSDPWHLVERKLRDGEQIPVSDYYRAPEQLNDPETEMFESDLYAVGLILGELIAISPVKPGLALSLQVPRLTKRFDELFTTATALDPDARFDSVDAFAACMREAFSSVQKEGLWVRRMHETGSFRAIRLPSQADRVTEVAPLDEMTVASLVPEPESRRYDDDTDLVAIPEPVEPDYDRSDDYQDDRDDAQRAPIIPEADEDGGIEFVSEGRSKQVAQEQARGKGQHGKKGRNQSSQKRSEPREPMPRPIQTEQPRRAPEPAMAPPAPPTPERFEPRPATARPVMIQPAKAENKLPKSLLFVGIVIVILLAVIAYLLTSRLHREIPAPTTAVPSIAAVAPAPQTPARAPEAVPAPAAQPAPAAAPGTEQAPAAAPAAAPAPAPEPPPPPPPPPPEPPKVKAMAEMVMCASSDMALIVTDSSIPSGSGKKPSDVAFCIDKYELSSGDRPRGGLSVGSAGSACKKAGKKLCTAKQWQKACNNGAPAASNCNISGSLKKSGSSPKCVTRDGVFDMIGNIGEVTTDREVRGGDVSGGGSGCDYSAGKHFQPKATDGARCCMDPEYKL